MNEKLRELFPVTKEAVYLNHAAISPPPRPTVDAVKAQLEDVALNGSLNYRSWVAVKERARQNLAKLLGARASQVAFVRNTSDALSTVANGLKWRAGENVVTFRREFPSNVYPWLRLSEEFGVEVRMAEERDGRVPHQELIKLIDSKTRVVAISHVQYASGFRADLEWLGRAARSRDALLVVDSIQALGVIPTDVEAELVDVAAGACHKWLLTPEGLGYIYLSDRARERLRPTLVGWMSVEEPEDYFNFEQPWKEAPLSWETGTLPTALIHGLDASLHLLLDAGVERINAHLNDLTDYLCESLRGRDYRIISSRRAGEKSQIVAVEHTGEWSAMKLYSHLKRQNIIVAPRAGRLRIAPHLYNTSDDIDRLIEALP